MSTLNNPPKPGDYWHAEFRTPKAAGIPAAGAPGPGEQSAPGSYYIPADEPWHPVFFQLREPGFGPKCVGCEKRSLVRLKQYSEDVGGRVFGCFECRAIQVLRVGAPGLYMVRLEPTCLELLAMSLALTRALNR